MKSKKFDEVKPYTYWIQNISTGIKYVGLRYNNIKKNRSPLDDFGKYYFTSGRLKKEFKQNPANFKTKLLFTYDTVEEAIEDELQLTKKAVNDNRYSNIASYPFIQPTEESVKKMSMAKLGKKLGPHSEEHRRKISNSLKGHSVSDEARKKMSKASKGRPGYFKGKNLSEETKQKISASLMGNESPRKGVKLSEETKMKMSKAKKGKPSHNKGKPMSEEQKKKISASLMGHPSPRKGKTNSEETRMKISLARKGQKLKPMSREHKKKISEATTGVKKSKLSEETKKKMAESQRLRREREKNRQIKRIKSLT